MTGTDRATKSSILPLLFAAGHEHSLQLHRDAVGAYYAVSGAGSMSKVNRVEAMPTSMYSEAAAGYMRLDAHASGALEISVTAVRDERRETTLRHCLSEGPAGS